MTHNSTRCHGQFLWKATSQLHRKSDGETGQLFRINYRCFHFQYTSMHHPCQGQWTVHIENWALGFDAMWQWKGRSYLHLQFSISPSITAKGNWIPKTQSKCWTKIRSRTAERSSWLSINIPRFETKFPKWSNNWKACGLSSFAELMRHSIELNWTRQTDSLPIHSAPYFPAHRHEIWENKTSI